MYLVPAYSGAGYPGYGYADGYSDYGDAGSGQGSAPNADIAAGDESQPDPSSRDPYLAAPLPFSRPSPVPSAANEAAVTLVFKDGRPPVQVHNYALTRTTLYVLDEGTDTPKNLPVNMIDLEATARVNRDAGVDFQLPVTLR